MSQLTRNAIAASFVKLLNERPLDKITVKDIVEDCGINRKTFYYHFEDIYDLLKSVFRTETEKLEKSLPEDETLEECVFRIASFILENKKAVLHIYRSVSRDDLQQFLIQSALEPISGLVRRKACAVPHTEEDVTLLCELYASGFASLIMEWLRTGMRTAPEDTLKKLSVMFDGSVAFALNNLNKKGL